MKKCCSLVFCFLLTFSLTATAFASYNLADYIEEYSSHIPEPVPEDYGGICFEFMDAHDAWVNGLHIFAEEREKAKTPPPSEDPVPEVIPEKPIESAGSSHVVLPSYVDTSLDTSVNDKYPNGSWIDPAGNVYSPSGELLSPGTTPAAALDPDAVKNESSSSGVAADSNFSSAADPLPLTDDLAQPVWYVEDLRPAAAPVDVLTGLKAMMTSIFGEYTPVTTISVISETVGSETRH